MNRLQMLVVAAATCLGFPAFAQDGVHILDPYARTTGPKGATAAVFFTVENTDSADDQLLSVASDAAKVAELHTHIEDANGVMKMTAVPEGFVIPGKGAHALARGGDHVMLMGLTAGLADGDVITVTLTFRNAGVVVVDAVVDNARMPEPQLGHKSHMDAKASP